MKSFILSFFSDDDGAVTVDFVVLTAAIVFLGFIVVNTFSVGAVDLANGISNKMGNMRAEP